MPFNRKFLSSMWSATYLSKVSNKAASSVDKEKLLKGYFRRGYSSATIVSLLEKSHGVRMYVRMLKRKLKNRPLKLWACLHEGGGPLKAEVTRVAVIQK